MSSVLNNIIKDISISSQNIPGCRLDKKILVIESDDWGAIRMPSKKSYENLLSKGIRVDRDPFNRLDSLENQTDLEALYEVLTSFKDIHGNHLKITANTLVANPDFEKIRQSGFSTYAFENNADTYERINGNKTALHTIQQGIKKNIFIPQLHGREHLHVRAWLHALRENDTQTKIAFDNEVWGQPTGYFGDSKMNFSSAFHVRDQEDESYISGTLQEAAKLFRENYGFTSESFIAPRYIWNDNIEKALHNSGVKYIQGLIVQRIPKGNNLKSKIHLQGSRNKTGQRYLVRNVFFEPSVNPDFPWIKDALKRVRAAFYWNKPAIICMHRINFMGGLDEANRSHNLSLLKTLITQVQKQFPEVIFLSTPELGKQIEYGN